MGFSFKTKIKQHEVDSDDEEEASDFFDCIFVITGDCGMKARFAYDPQDTGGDKRASVSEWTRFIENLRKPGHDEELVINGWNGDSSLYLKDGILTFYNSKGGGMGGSAYSTVSIPPTAQVQEEMMKVPRALATAQA